jgi:hypothetical protein
MLLRMYSFFILGALASLSAYLVWLLRLPLQAGFSYDVSDSRYVQVGYIDFVFLIIVTCTIVLIITRPLYQKALEQKLVSRFDHRLYKTMFNLPLILICLQCAFILLAVFAISLSI